MPISFCSASLFPNDANGHAAYWIACTLSWLVNVRSARLFSCIYIILTSCNLLNLRSMPPVRLCTDHFSMAQFSTAVNCVHRGQQLVGEINISDNMKFVFVEKCWGEWIHWHWFWRKKSVEVMMPQDVPSNTKRFSFLHNNDSVYSYAFLVREWR